LKHGDLSILSFHATKVFNTFEGGAIICPDLKTRKRIDQLKNFGYVDEINVVAPGINGKMSEFNAALGILQLKHIGKAIEKREVIDNLYREKLKNVRGITFLKGSGEKKFNYAYFPILLDDHFPITRDDLYNRMRGRGIYPRRYFYPLISEFPMYRGFPSAARDNLPVATRAANQILCLPIYPDLPIEITNIICDLISSL